jgi:uncharacterized membrane protein YeiB
VFLLQLLGVGFYTIQHTLCVFLPFHLRLALVRQWRGSQEAGMLCVLWPLQMLMARR